MLAAALKQLTERERHIIVERRLIDEPKTLEDLSAKYGISRERVRQIEVRAFEKLQKAMKNMVVEAASVSLSKQTQVERARRRLFDRVLARRQIGSETRATPTQQLRWTPSQSLRGAAFGPHASSSIAPRAGTRRTRRSSMP